MSPAISVVVPMLDAERSIRHMLTSLLAQRFDRPWEVVVVDNGSSDAGVGVARTLLDGANHPTLVRHQVAVVASPQGYGTPRNHGVELSHAPLVAFCDADGAVDEGWLAAMVAALERHPLVGSRKLMVDDVASRSADNVVSDLDELPTFGRVPVVGAAGLGCTRELFDELGGFDPEFDTGGEDTDFAVRAGRRGVEPVLAREAIYWTSRPQRWSRLFTRGVRDGRSQVRLLVRHADLCAEPPSWPAITLRRLAGAVYRMVRPRAGQRRRQAVHSVGFAVGRATTSARLRVRHY